MNDQREIILKSTKKVVDFINYEFEGLSVTTCSSILISSCITLLKSILMSVPDKEDKNLLYLKTVSGIKEGLAKVGVDVFGLNLWRKKSMNFLKKILMSPYINNIIWFIVLCGTMYACFWTIGGY